MSSCGVHLAALLLTAASGSATPDAAALLRAADAPRRALDEGVLFVRARVERPGKPATVQDLEVYVRGDDRALCVFREGAQRGRKVLTVGDRVWLIVPGTKNAVPISASQRLLGGASVADLARLTLAEEFDGMLRAAEETVDQHPCLVLDLRARSAQAQYATGTLWMGREDRLPRRLRLALPSGKEAKEVRFLEYGREGGRSVLARMEIVHLLRGERGARTVLEFLRREPRPVADALFDPSGARELP